MLYSVADLYSCNQILWSAKVLTQGYVQNDKIYMRRRYVTSTQDEKKTLADGYHD